jgi:hypothetical protein
MGYGTTIEVFLSKYAGPEEAEYREELISRCRDTFIGLACASPHEVYDEDGNRLNWINYATDMVEEEIKALMEYATDQQKDVWYNRYIEDQRMLVEVLKGTFAEMRKQIIKRFPVDTDGEEDMVLPLVDEVIAEATKFAAASPNDFQDDLHKDVNLRRENSIFLVACLFHRKYRPEIMIVDKVSGKVYYESGIN